MLRMMAADYPQPIMPRPIHVSLILSLYASAAIAATRPDNSLDASLAQAADVPDAIGPLRLVSRTGGLEVHSRELRAGAMLVALVNRSGTAPRLDESKAIHTGPVITRKTPGHAEDIDVPIKGARKLWLAVTDGGDGESGDHADWADPVLSGPAGTLRLTDLPWKQATAGWKSPVTNRSVSGSAMKIGEQTPAIGIGTHSKSVIEYDIPAGYERLRARTGLDAGANDRGSVRFLVFTENPWISHEGAEPVSITARELGFSGNIQTAPAAVLAGDTITASVARGAFKLLRVTSVKPAPRTRIHPGEVWGDTDGRVIQAHGGGILRHNGTYYWYGENKDGPNTAGGVERTDVIGVSCYSSTDLLNWKNHGLVLKAVNTAGHDLHPSMVLERPKVIHNARTGKFVMWAHVDSADYSYARAGVAVSDSPTGPFKYAGSVRPEGQMSRDMTLFVDDDGTAYHIYSSENNATLYISKLSEDFTKHTGVFKRVFERKFLEAPAVFKRDGKYYMILSGQSGWAPNPAHSAVADSMLGEWKELGNPCRGKDSQTTYRSQSTHIIPIAGKPDSFVFMGDRWNPPNLRDSRYVWLPLRFEDGKPALDWKESWAPSDL